MPYAWGYVRVSESSQLLGKAIVNNEVTADTSIQTQKHSIQEWWAANQKRYPEHRTGENWIFEDPAQSARKIPLALRPQGSIMLSYLGKGDIIIAADFERVFRDPNDYYNTTDTLRKKGVTFIFLNMPEMDWSTLEGELVGEMLSSVKRYEARVTARRISIAYHSREARGLVTGPYIPPGFKKQVSIVDDKVLKFFVPCKRERWLLRIFRWMRKMDPQVWKREVFHKWVREYDVRRGPKGEKRLWHWEEFVVSPVIVEAHFPQYMLALAHRGYRRDRISAEIVRVRPRLAPEDRQQLKQDASVTLEDLWNAPPGTSVLKLRHQRYREQAALRAEAASQEPDNSPDPLRSAPFS
jgi:DNA invertase Pin-like site-specific DNA recombinase